jgi:hypothetical protein
LRSAPPLRLEASNGVRAVFAPRRFTGSGGPVQLRQARARQRAPDLEGMDERAAHEFLAELYSLLSAEAEHRIRHDEYTMEWPPIRRATQRPRHDEGLPRVQRRIATPKVAATRAGEGRAVGGVGERGLRRRARFGLRAHPGAARRDGLQVTRYYAEPFEASEERAEWFERMER